MGHPIDEICAKLGVSRAQLARKLKCPTSPQTLCDVVKGRHGIGTQRGLELEKLAGGLYTFKEIVVGKRLRGERRQRGGTAPGERRRRATAELRT